MEEIANGDKVSGCAGRTSITDGDGKEPSEQVIAVTLLQSTSPWCYISPRAMEEISRRSHFVHFGHGHVIYNKGDTSGDVYIVKSGRVRYCETELLAIYVPPNSYFGDRGFLFSECRAGSATADGETTCLCLPHSLLKEIVGEGAKWNPLLEQQNGFKLALSSILVHRQHVFHTLQRFMLKVSADVASEGSLQLRELLALYQKLRPAIHSKIDSIELDIDAWDYALHRLPQRISSYYSLVLSRRVIDVLDSDEFCHFIERRRIGRLATTSARRRFCWETGPGKLFILLRDNTTDLLDFLTCLCVHAVEANKLRSRLKPLSASLPHILESLEAAEKAQKAGPRSVEPEEIADRLLSKLSMFSPAEKAGLKRLWPTNLIASLYNIVVQHNDFSIYVDQAFDDRSIDESQKWSDRVQSTLRELIGDFTLGDIVVDLISSNTHSVINCLSPYLHKRRKLLYEWGNENAKEIMEAPFRTEQDRLYAVAHRYFKSNPEQLAIKSQEERDCGMVTLEENEFTGISVQLIDVCKLDRTLFDSCIKVEPIPTSGSPKKHVILNIDYAFGRQAEDVFKTLILTFGSSIRSINVLGKAGGLTGNRGDILFPTHILLQVQDELRSVDNSDISTERLQEMSGRSIHVGPILTIEGTLLQNQRLLWLYKRLWRCIGLEMEGSYYLRQIERSMQLNLLRGDVRNRFVYYTSDLPLQSGSSLATSMSPWEGIPPLYAITRLILERVLETPKAAEPVSILSPTSAAKLRRTTHAIAFSRMVRRIGMSTTLKPAETSI